MKTSLGSAMLILLSSLVVAAPALADADGFHLVDAPPVVTGFTYARTIQLGASSTFFEPRVKVSDESTIAISALTDPTGLCIAMGFQIGELGAMQFRPDSDVYAAVFASSGVLEKVVATNLAGTDEIVTTVTCQ